MKKIWPPLVLFLLAPVIGELLSGYTPPSEFFTPLPFFALAVLYGGGVLLIREITVRKGWGWYSTILLGVAFVIIKEGLIRKSFYDPSWQDIGILGYYGRWAGINWIWGIELTIYLAFVGVAVPIFLAGLAFPSVRRDGGDVVLIGNAPDGQMTHYLMGPSAAFSFRNIASASVTTCWR